MTETEKLRAQLAELQSTIAAEKEGQQDPQLRAKAEQFLQFSVNDIKIVLEVLGIEPTLEQKQEIEEALIDNKIAQLEKSQANKARGTKASW